MAIFKYEDLGGHTPQSVGQFICSTTDFTVETNKPDGASLVTVDEATHKVDKYYIAFNGNWNEL